MVGHSRGSRGRRNQGQQTEMAEMRRMIEDLSRAVQSRQQRELVGAHMEILEGKRKPLDIPEGLNDESDDIENENPFHDAGP